MNSFSDNVLVKRGRNHGEFFKIVFHAEPVNDVEVCIYRYILPGRVDVYNFSYDFRNGDICFPRTRTRHCARLRRRCAKT